MKSTYTRNSLIHQALEALDRLPRSPEQLRTNLVTISMTRFNEAVTEPLLQDGLARHEGGVLVLTALGREKISFLGMTKTKLPSSHKNAIMNIPYDAAELLLKPVRYNADQHESFPSRVGNHLHYRDGRVEELA
jgi:hypothetical protein